MTDMEYGRLIAQLADWHKQDQYQKVIDTLEALPAHERNYELTGLLARALNNADRERDALEVLALIADEGANDPLWHFRRGYALFYSGQTAEAKTEFERVLELEPADEDAADFITRCDELLAQNDPPVGYTSEEMERVEKIIAARFGAFDQVYHEKVSPDLHLDICLIPPNDENDFYTLVTLGMSAYRMQIPEELSQKGLERAELVLCLPSDWKLPDADERWYWPIRLLKVLARLPLREKSWLGWGHTLDYEEPYAENTPFTSAMLTHSWAFDEQEDAPEEERINFYQVIPLRPEEMEYKKNYHAQALFDLLPDDCFIVDNNRPSCLPRPRKGLHPGAGAPEYAVTVPRSFADRVDDFWAWFSENEPALSKIIENRGADGPDQVVAFINKGTDLISDDLHYNIGGDYEFTFAVSGDSWLFYLMPWVVARLPREFRDKWHFFPCMQQAERSDFGMQMHGVEASVAEVQIALDFNEERSIFSLQFYHEGICGLPENQALNYFYVLMENTIGEGLARIYVAQVDCADAPLEDAFPLSELAAKISETVSAHGKALMSKPDQQYSVYRFDPKEDDRPRFDIEIGTTCYSELVSDYYDDECENIDGIEAYGAEAGFLFWPTDDELDGKENLQLRYALEERIEQEILGERGSGEEIGILLGGAIGDCAYIDLLLFDPPAFFNQVRELLDEYPYVFYYSPFRQGEQLTELFEMDEDAPSED